MSTRSASKSIAAGDPASSIFAIGVVDEQPGLPLLAAPASGFRKRKGSKSSKQRDLDDEASSKKSKAQAQSAITGESPKLTVLAKLKAQVAQLLAEKNAGSYAGAAADEEDGRKSMISGSEEGEGPDDETDEDEQDRATLSRSLSVEKIHLLIDGGNPMYRGIQIGAAQDAQSGCCFLMVLVDDDEEIGERLLFQLRGDGSAICIAANHRDYFSGTPSDEKVSLVTMAIKPEYVFGWLDKVGCTLILEKPSYCSIWEGMRAPFVTYGSARKNSASPASIHSEKGNHGTITRKLLLSEEDGDKKSAMTNKISFLTTVNTAPSAKYARTSRFMFTVPQARLLAVKSAGKSSDDSVGRMADALYSAGGSKTAIRKVGTISEPFLNVISAADPKEVLTGNLADMLIRVLDHRAIPCDTYTLSQLLSRWNTPDGSDGMNFFCNMVAIYGQLECNTRMMKYRALSSFTEGAHSKEFEKLYIGSEESKFLDGQVSRMEDALMNILSVITVSTSMRFCFQDVLFQSGLALVEYFNSKDFGQKSPLMLPFMKACIAEMMSQWQRARTVMHDCKRADTEQLLILSRNIPDLAPGGKIDAIFQYFWLLNATGGGMTAALILNHQQLPQGGAGILVRGVKSTTPIASSKKQKKSAVEKAQTAIAVAPMSSRTITITGSTGGLKNYCSSYNSADGCSYGSACKYKHENPVRGSSEAARLSKFFTYRKMTVSKDFVDNSQ